MTFERGDIVVVPFPFTDIPVGKVRPALVLSHARFCADSGHVICGMITGAKKSRWPFDTVIENWRDVGLTIPSVVRMKIFTLNSKLVLRTAGVLDSRTLHEIERMVGGLLA